MAEDLQLTEMPKAFGFGFSFLHLPSFYKSVRAFADSVKRCPGGAHPPAVPPPVQRQSSPGHSQAEPFRWGGEGLLLQAIILFFYRF